MTQVQDYYQILQISRDATLNDIKAAFRRLARQYHPDLNPQDHRAAEHFKLISQAYEVLSDSDKRRRYDRDYRTESGQATKTVTTAQSFYNRGLQKAQVKQYQQAIETFSKAIEINPSFIDAYLKRCEMRYKLGNNKGVLEDCYQVIKINPTVAKAYYYQGRSRYRLGYTESAIDAYTEAVSHDQSYAQAFYYRGVAHRELKNNTAALEDLQTAAELFRVQGNHSAYRLTKKTTRQLSKISGKFEPIYLWSSDLLAHAWIAFATFIFNPGGGLLPAFSRLDKNQAAVVGLFYGAIANFFLVVGTYLAWQQPDFPFFPILAIGTVPFLSLIATAQLIRLFMRNSGDLSADVFIAGAALIPLGIVALILGLLPLSAIAFTIIVFGSCYAILILYTGLSQICNLAEAKAAFCLPLMLLISSWLFYSAWNAVVN